MVEREEGVLKPKARAESSGVPIPIRKPGFRVIPSLLVIWGIALACVSLLDWVGYGSFWLSFAFR